MSTPEDVAARAADSMAFLSDVERKAREACNYEVSDAYQNAWLVIRDQRATIERLTETKNAVVMEKWKAEAEVERLHAALAGLFSKHASWGERVITAYLIEMIDEDGLQVSEETAAHEIIQRLADDFAAALAPAGAEGWRPIETAPKDGTRIWAFTEEGAHRVVYWVPKYAGGPDDPGHEAGWMSLDGATYPAVYYHGPIEQADPPTDWMPLPAPPSASPAPATPPAEARDLVEQRVAVALCKSGKFETGQGTCALLCMDQLGDPRKSGCSHAQHIHQKLASRIVAALSPASAKTAEDRG